MSDTPRDLVVVITRGIDHELSSVALTIARGGMNNGLRVSLFLTSSGVDLARKRGMELTHVPPIDPAKDIMAEIINVLRGGSARSISDERRETARRRREKQNATRNT